MRRLNLWKPEPTRRSGIVRMPPVVPGVPLSKYTNAELGVRIARRSGQPRQEPGVAWARLMHSSNRPEKDAAREAVLAMMSVARFPTLSVLTFPASDWRFETTLLARRGEPEASGPRATRLVSLERDVAVYRAACHNIPRGADKKGRIRLVAVPSFASAAAHSVKISAFFCCTFEDYALKAADEECYPGTFDAAWLDFNGQLTQARLNAIERFWARQVRSLLVVTLLKLNMADWMWARVKHHGGIEQLLAARLSGSEVETVVDYADGAPMVQVALRRISGSPTLSWVGARDGET